MLAGIDVIGKILIHIIFWYSKTSHNFLKTHPSNKNVKITSCVAISVWASPVRQVIILYAVHQISHQMFHTPAKKKQQKEALRDVL